MAKDPAFPFYTQDFLVGTMFLTDEETGIFVRLLCIQHQHGGLIDKNTFISKTENYPNLKVKFVETEDGFFNKRLMTEMVKRQNKSNNLSANATKRWEIEKQMQCKSIAIAMPYEDEDVDEDDNDIENEIKSVKLEAEKRKIFRIPTIAEILDYAKEINYVLDAELFFDTYEANGWRVGKNEMKNWKAVIRKWKKNNYHNVNYIEKRFATPNENGEFHKLQIFVRDETNKISQLPDQLTYGEAVNLSEKYNIDELTNIFRAMENRSDLLIKNNSVYLTTKNWLERTKNSK